MILKDLIVAAILFLLALFGMYWITWAAVQPARAEPHTISTLSDLDDTIEFEVLKEHELARICYHNHEAALSNFAFETFPMGDLKASIEVNVTGGPEFATIEPPKGWYADPAEMAVDDGDTGCSLLRPIPTG